MPDLARTAEPSAKGTESRPDRFLKIAEVKERTALGKTEIYARVKAKTFPKPVPLSEHRVAWVESEINAWIAGIIAKRVAP